MTQTQSKINNIPFTGGGYYNPSFSTAFLKNEDVYPAVFSELLTLPEFQKELKRIYSVAYGDSPVQSGSIDENGDLIAPDGFLIVGISIFGRGMVVVLPKEYANLVAGGGSSKASCSCTEGSCKIKETSAGLQKVTSCQGDCSGTCTLTLGSDPTGNNYFQIVNYDF